VNPETGDVRLTGGLDFEQRAQHELRVEARDNGEPPRHSQASLHLEVLDVNDNAPVFDHQQQQGPYNNEEDWKGSVVENSLPGTRILQVLIFIIFTIFNYQFNLKYSNFY
jgi:hypothetical protein